MGAWTYTVLVGGVAKDIAGTVTVRSEESTAGTAQFSYVPAVGVAFNPSDILGDSVVVKHGATALFTGTVNAAVPASDGLIKVTATDGLLAYFDGLDEAGILSAITGGKYHTAFFGQRTSGWAQAQSVLETVPSEVHMTPAGVLEVSSWLGAVTETITDAVYLSEGVDFSDERNRVNRVEITLKYRFTRLKERRASLLWTHPNFSSLLTWAANPTTLPSRDMVQAAADGTGWGVIGGIQYVTLPDNVGAWQPETGQQKTDVIQASCNIFFRWTQAVTETYTLGIQADASATPVLSRDVALEEPFDAATWAGLRVAFDTGWSQDSLNDFFYDQVDRSDLNDLAACAIAWGQTRLAFSRRQNYIQFAIVCDPSLTLDDRVSLTTDWVTASGKVYALEHRLDTGESGADLTVVTLACSDDSATSEGSVTPPSPPDTSPNWSIGTVPGMSDTHIGSDTGVPSDDPTWIGYIGNYDPHLGGTGDQIYDGRFRIGAPEIETESLDEITASNSGEYGADTTGGSITFTPSPS